MQSAGISIHAPRTGSDDDWKKLCAKASAFQSTLPARGATIAQMEFSSSTAHFNPRSPHGERHGGSYSFFCPGKFQSTLPARGATKRKGRVLQYFLISIHAPRTGSDAITFEAILCDFPFQSTLPARGATYMQSGFYIEEADFNPRSPHGERPFRIAQILSS